MIFPIIIETCRNCGSFMDEKGTITAPKGIYFTHYECYCGHKLTVMRDLN